MAHRLLSRPGKQPTGGLQTLQLNTGASLANGLVGWWPAGHLPSWQTSTTYDLSGNGNDGVLTGGGDSVADWVEDGGRYAFDFAGHSGYFLADSLANITTGTVSQWVKVSTDGRSLEFINGNWFIGPTTGDSFLFRPGSGNREMTSGTYGSAWTHIAMTWNKNTDVSKCYQDGVELDSSTVGTSSHAYDVKIGGSIGLIDDSRIYNTDLSGADITQMVNETSGGGYGSIAL